MSPLKSLSPIETNLPNLPLFPLPDQTTPIVGRVLDFNSNNDAPIFQMCGHPQVKDTNTVQYRPNNDAAMVDVPKGSGIARLEDPIGIESTLWNAFLDGCQKIFQLYVYLMMMQMIEVKSVRGRFTCPIM
jgi:hypothetical protein